MNVLVQLSKYNYLNRKWENEGAFIITIFRHFVEFARLPESNLLILATLNVELAPTSVKSVRTLEKEKAMWKWHETQINFRVESQIEMVSEREWEWKCHQDLVDNRLFLSLPLSSTIIMLI